MIAQNYRKASTPANLVVEKFVNLALFNDSYIQSVYVLAFVNKKNKAK